MGAGSEVDFEVMFRGDLDHTPGSYVANITADVTEANGIQVGFITSPESSDVTIVVAEYSGCTQCWTGRRVFRSWRDRFLLGIDFL